MVQEDIPIHQKRRYIAKEKSEVESFFNKTMLKNIDKFNFTHENEGLG